MAGSNELINKVHDIWPHAPNGGNFSSAIRPAVAMAVVTGLYFALVVTSHDLKGWNSDQILYLPQYGLALAALASFRGKRSLFIMAAFLCGELAARAILPQDTEAGLTIALANLGIAFAGAQFYRWRKMPFDPTSSLTQFGAFIAVCCVLSGLSACAAALALLLQASVAAISLPLISKSFLALMTGFLSIAPAASSFSKSPYRASSHLLQPANFILGGIMLALVSVSIFNAAESEFVVIDLAEVVTLLLMARLCDITTVSAGFFLIVVSDLYLNRHGLSIPISPFMPANAHDPLIQIFELIRGVVIMFIFTNSRVTRTLMKSNKAQSARLGSIIETCGDAIVSIDERGVIDTFNKAAERMFGYTQGEAIGKNVEMLMPDEFARAHDGFLKNYLKTGHKKIIGIGRIVNGKRKDHSLFPVEINIGEMEAAPGHSFVAFMRDITPRQDAERRMRELQDELVHVSRISAMGELASAIAHELNQPLTAIQNYAMASRLMVENASAKDEVLGTIDKLYQQAGRAGDVIKRMRGFISKRMPEVAPADIYHVIAEANALALIGVRDEGIAVRFIHDGKLPPVIVDRVQIQQVLINLIRNAIDAMRGSSKRELTIETWKQGEMVEVRVSDTGPGISPEAARRLFTPFQSTKRDGLGIGLSISRSIAEFYGGSLRFEPNAAGGATFILTLPLAHERVGKPA